MASASIIAILGILHVLQPMTARGDILAPLLSPFFDDVCKEVECGKGTCKPSRNNTFLFVCECDPGWKQTRPDHDHYLNFLPCIVPNCTLNYTCSEAQAPSPVEEKGNPPNESFFEPCYWTNCGGGSCNKTSKFTHSCVCREGYYNLLNVTAFPCFRQCELGAECSNLGISVSNKSTSSTPNLVDSGKNQASSILPGNFHWWIILPMLLTMVLWK